jgi:hypothetical protein
VVYADEGVVSLVGHLSFGVPGGSPPGKSGKKVPGTAIDSFNSSNICSRRFFFSWREILADRQVRPAESACNCWRAESSEGRATDLYRAGEKSCREGL